MRTHSTLRWNQQAEADELRSNTQQHLRMSENQTVETAGA